MIKTKRLTLTPLGTDVLGAFCEYANNPENTRLMKFMPYSGREEALGFLEDCERQWKSPLPEYYEFAVLLSGELIGNVGFYYEGHTDRGELGWIFNNRFHGKGYATEAARAVLDWCREELGIYRFYACCDSENAASRRVMEKLGMSLVSVTGGRKNRSCDEERLECLYEVSDSED